MRHGGFCTWGIQTGPLSAFGADFIQKIVHLFYFHTGKSNHLLPQREEKPKKGFTEKWLRHGCFCTWGIQPRPLPACSNLPNFVPKKFPPFFYFHIGESNYLLPQREENEKKGFIQKWMRHGGFPYFCHSNWTISSLWSGFRSKMFPPF